VAKILLHTAPAHVFTLFLPVPQDAEDDEVHHVAKNDDAAKEKDGEEPGVTNLDSGAWHYRSGRQMENVGHSVALPDLILFVGSVALRSLRGSVAICACQP
jgi:hypothetical protein